MQCLAVALLKHAYLVPCAHGLWWIGLGLCDKCLIFDVGETLVVGAVFIGLDLPNVGDGCFFVCGKTIGDFGIGDVFLGEPLLGVLVSSRSFAKDDDDVFE